MKRLNIVHLFFALLAFTFTPIAASAQAPDSLVGFKVTMTITGGIGGVQNGDTASVTPTDSSRCIFVNDGGESIAGSYSYTKESSDQGTLEILIDSASFTLTSSLSFQNSTSGTFYLTLDAEHQAWGTFALTSAVTGVPGRVRLDSPWNGSEFSADSGIILHWLQTTPASTWFHLYLQRNGVKCVELWTQDTSWTCPTNLGAGEFKWWVQGWNSAGLGNYSDGWGFSTPSTMPHEITGMYTYATQASSPTLQYYWSLDEHATWYQLCITKNGATVQNNWYQLSDSILYGGYSSQFCLQIDGHSQGSYNWWVRGWSPGSSGGMGTWSPQGSFTVSGLTPDVPSPYAPYGQQYTHSPSFGWSLDGKATWYELCVTKDGEIVLDKWFTASDASKGVDWTFSAGNYSWWVRGWSADGMGDWSTGASFQIMGQVPSASSPMFPSGSQMVSSPTFSWTQATGASDIWYLLWIFKDGAKYYSTWVHGTSWSPTAPLPKGHYQWWVQTWAIDGYGPWSNPATSFSIGYYPY